MPLGELVNVGPHSEVIPTGNCLTVKVGDGLLGRILNGLGEPMDSEFNGPLNCTEEFPVLGYPPDPLKRQRVNRPISLGVRAIDAVLTKARAVTPEETRAEFARYVADEHAFWGKKLKALKIDME